jgi:hypothetical protein
VLDALGADLKRKAMIPWLQDHIVPLVGPDAARALERLLNHPTEAAANDFVQKALMFQMNLERGFETPYGAVEEWRKKKGQP